MFVGGGGGLRGEPDSRAILGAAHEVRIHAAVSLHAGGFAGLDLGADKSYMACLPVVKFVPFKSQRLCFSVS